MMIESIATLAARFSAHRMVMDYVPQVLPGRRRRAELGHEPAVDLAATAGSQCSRTCSEMRFGFPHARRHSDIAALWPSQNQSQ